MIDDEDFCSSDEEDLDEDLKVDEIGTEAVETPCKKPSLFKSRLMKGVSLGNLKFPFHTSTTPRSSPTMKKAKSSSILIDIEKDDEKRKLLTESFDSEESDLFFSMCDATKEHWHVDVSNINYFLNQTGMHEHPAVRNSMSPITKSTQRMPKSMQVNVDILRLNSVFNNLIILIKYVLIFQESIMTPRSRKPVMLAIFGNSDPKSYQKNISKLLEESGEMQNVSSSASQTPHSSGEIPLTSLQLENLPSMSESDMSSANDNGLPVVETVTSNGSNSSSNPDSLSSAFM